MVPSGLHIPQAREALDVPSVLVYLEALDVPGVKEWIHWLVCPKTFGTMKKWDQTHQVPLESPITLFSSLSFGPLVKQWHRKCTLSSVEERKHTSIAIVTYFQILWIMKLLWIILQDHLRVQAFLDSHSLPRNGGRNSQTVTAHSIQTCGLVRVILLSYSESRRSRFTHVSFISLITLENRITVRWEQTW